MFGVQVREDVKMMVNFTHHYPESTTCWLTLPLDKAKFTCTDRSMVWESAECHPDDQWNKNIGRKVSLAKVLEKVGVQREWRTVIWNRYFEVRGKIN